MDYAEQQTDIEVAKVEKHLSDVYKNANKELQQITNDYFSKFAERYEKEYDAFLQGKYTAQEFKMWYYTQVGRGERWQTIKTDMAKKMVSLNQEAAAYINSKTPGIYALNANFTAYEIEKKSGIAFNIVSDDVVRELALDKNHSEFRVLSVNPKRDYEWNQKRIQNELLSGILQGKSIDRLADGFLNVMGSNRGAAIRNARTALTSAQNAGRQNTFNRAEELGIEVEKEWIATADNRTRDSHKRLDGVIVKNNEEFPNGLMYPGDPDGEPEEVYNCRCSIRAILPKYTNGAAWQTKESYLAWKENKENEKLTTNSFKYVSKRGILEDANSAKKYDINVEGHGYMAEDFIEYPELFTKFSPYNLKIALEEAGYDVRPLGKGGLKGIAFENGGGYGVNFGGNKYLQYHPEEGSHHEGEYYKTSSSKNGIRRYTMKGVEF